jgi:integrase
MAQHTVPNDISRLNLDDHMAHLSRKTQIAYRRWIAIYIKDSLRIEPDLTALEAAHIAGKLNALQFRDWLFMLRDRRAGKQTLLQARAAITWLAHTLAENNVLAYEVPAALKLVRTPASLVNRRTNHWLTVQQSRRLLEKILGETETPRQARDAAIVTLMLTCGLRADEVRKAMWSDLRPFNGGQHILYVHGKGDNLRVVKLPDLTYQAINKWAEFHPDPTGDRPMFTDTAEFAQGISNSTVYIVVRGAGSMIGETLAPHDLRRTFARGAYEAGADLEKIRQSLGHSSLAQTQTYINARPQTENTAAEVWGKQLQRDTPLET